MEDLIEIKSKKEQTMTDLENLKSEIIKNKTFLESLKKIDQREEIKGNLPSSARYEEAKEVNSKIPTNLVVTPEISNKQPQFQSVSENQLPDLVNNEATIKYINKETEVSPERLQHPNLSQDYMKHLQKMGKNNDKTAEQSDKIPLRTPPQLYSKHKPP